MWIFVDKSNPLPGLTDGLLGKKINDAPDIETTLPKDFEEAKYRGKSALFKVRIIKIKEKQIPPLNHEFAKKLGPYKTAEELKKAVREDLTRKLWQSPQGNV